jgi:MerR family transcriptional regulator, copper efflux regulator
MAFRIGNLARDAGTTPPTIRYYESIGLLEAPARTGAGYREYSARARQELLFIRKAQGIGFSLEEIREILGLTRTGKVPCARVRSIGHRHLTALDDRIARLQRFRTQLANEVRRWDAEVSSTCDGFCQWIASLADDVVAPEETVATAQRRTVR